jgi:hypothetical protein
MHADEVGRKASHQAGQGFAYPEWLRRCIDHRVLVLGFEIGRLSKIDEMGLAAAVLHDQGLVLRDWQRIAAKVLGDGIAVRIGLQLHRDRHVEVGQAVALHRDPPDEGEVKRGDVALSPAYIDASKRDDGMGVAVDDLDILCLVGEMLKKDAYPRPEVHEQRHTMA